MGRIRQLVQFTTIALFLAALGLPLVGQALIHLGIGEPSRLELNENRHLAPPPGIPRDTEAALAFPAAFDRYYSDNFPFREALVLAAVNLKVRTGIAPYDYLLVGKEGWLYLRDNIETKTVGRFEPLEASAALHFRDEMARFRDALAARGIQFIHFPVPEKETLYPEFLPTRFTLAEQNRLAQAAALFEGEPGFVDATAILKESKAKSPDRRLYHWLDSHWNCWGAFLVYRGAMEVVRRNGLLAPVVSTNEITLNDVTARRGHGLSAREYWLGDPARRDTAYECLMDAQGLEMSLKTTGEPMPNIHGGRDLPEAGLSIPTALYQTWHSKNERPGAKHRAVIVRDSYGSAMAPYFLRSFREALFLHSAFQSPGTLDRVIRTFKPDVVVYQYSEQMLNAPAEKILRALASDSRNRARD